MEHGTIPDVQDDGNDDEDNGNDVDDEEDDQGDDNTWISCQVFLNFLGNENLLLGDWVWSFIEVVHARLLKEEKRIWNEEMKSEETLHLIHWYERAKIRLEKVSQDISQWAQKI